MIGQIFEAGYLASVSLRKQMFRSQSPRLWSFRAALDDVADMLSNIGDSERTQSRSPGAADYRTSSECMTPALNGISASRTYGAPLSQVSKTYAGYMAPDRSERNGPADDAKRLKDLLNSKPRLTRKELIHIRRAFAKSHHPDCVPPHRRVAAEQDMAMMNALVDRALAYERAMRAEST